MKCAFPFFVVLLIVAGILNSCGNSNENEIKSIMIPARDGTLLSTDLYFPSNSAKSYPVILMRTPYDKKLLKEYGDFYSQNGFVMAIQDVRGKYESEGDWMPYEFEGKDGYDVIEWLARQEWSNGKVGMVGGSYSGSVQLAAAVESPPHLVTIIPNITPATPFNNTPYENGVFALGWGIRWSDIVHQNITGKEMNEKFGQVFQRNWYNELNSLPVIDLDKKIIGQEVDFWRKWIEIEPGINDYYNDQNYLAHISKITIPVFIQSGWFDVANRGTKLIYEQLAQADNKNVKLIIGPWVHSDRSSKQLGPLYLGEEAGIDLFALYAKWFDYWLKGENNGIMNDPLIQIFNIGPNNWIYSDEYPSDKSEESNLFIMPINAGDEIIDGVLSFEENVEVVASTSYTYDPGNPTPSFLAFMKKRKIVEYKKYIETREDLIIFETTPLKDSLIISGPISAVIYASSTALDTDFNLTLTGVNSNNEIIPIGQTFGIIRAKYRNTLNPELLEKNKIYEYKIDLSHTCYTLVPGEKLRLEIASASFPEFARNLNTGKNSLTTIDFIEAVQTIYFSKEYPSHITFSKF